MEGLRAAGATQTRATEVDRECGVCEEKCKGCVTKSGRGGTEEVESRLYTTRPRRGFSRLQAFFAPSPAIPHNAPSRSLAVATTPVAPALPPAAASLSSPVANGPAVELLDVVRCKAEVADAGEATEAAPPGLVVVGWIGAGAPGARAGFWFVGGVPVLDWA
jgi:hypothetical protein